MAFTSTKHNTHAGFNILDHLGKLTHHDRDKHICLACGGNNLSINLETGAYKCYSGCDSRAVREAIAPWADRQTEAPKTFRDWVYTSIEGLPLVRVRRVDQPGEKRIVWQEFWGDGGWQKAKDISKSVKAEAFAAVIPYRYLEAMSAIANKTHNRIYWVEGESCCDAMWDLGFAAVATIGGSGGYKNYADYSALFVEVNLVICPDRDLPGIKYANDIAQDHPEAQWLYVFPDSAEWDNLPQKNGLDVKDWIADGADKATIEAAVEGRRALVVADSEPQETKSSSKNSATVGEDEVSTPTATLWDCPTTEDYTIGVVEARGRGEDKEWVFVPRLACDFTVVKELKSAEGGGLILEVKNWCGTQLVVRQVIVKSIDCIKVDKFAEALTRGLGTQIACTLKPAELQALLQNRKQSYYLAGGKTYQLTDRFGRQADGAMVFSNCQFDKFGQPCTEVDSGWVFNPDLGTEDGITCPSIKPANPQALSELVRAMKAFYHPDNLGFALSDIGYAVATLFRDQILEMYNEFAQSSSDGPAGAGKSKGAKAAASIAGMHTRDRIIGKGSSDSALNENIKLCSSLPIVVDDFIPLDGALDEIKRAKKILNGTVTRAFDGTGRNVRKNKQGAHTNLLITTNIGIGGDSVALDQRIIMKTYLDRRVNVSQGEGDRLDRAMDNASGGLGQLLQISVDRDKIDRYAIDLKTRLPNADMRQARSLAIQTFSPKNFARLRV